MKIAVAGGTGFVGQSLCSCLHEEGHEVIVLTRDKSKRSNKRFTYVEWLGDADMQTEPLHGVHAIIHLAGESINTRWTEAKKKRILESRIRTTEAIHQWIKRLPEKPEVYLQASAVGFYGTSETKTFTEKNKQSGNDFLAQVASEWENAGKSIEKENIRTVFLRFGVILDRKEGALPRMVLPYQLFAGGTIGSGKQWLSWIHMNDVCRLIQFAVEKKNIRGPLNVTAPNPVQMKTFGKTIASVLKRPHWLPMPAAALNLLLGEMCMLVTKGQRVLPEKALQNGFRFQYNHLKEALEDLYRQ